MNKKFALLALPFVLLGCDTTELYPGDAYIDPEFTNNRYNHVYPFYMTEGSEGGNVL